MAQEHKLNKILNLTGNIAKYAWFASCICGFETRMPTEETAMNQLTAHLQYHGVVENPAIKPVVKNAVKNDGWKPKGAV